MYTAEPMEGTSILAPIGRMQHASRQLPSVQAQVGQSCTLIVFLICYVLFRMGLVRVTAEAVAAVLSTIFSND